MLPEQLSASSHSTISLPTQIIRGSAASCTDERVWKSLLGEAEIEDVYYRPGYVRAHEKAGHGRMVAVVVSIDESRFLLPLLLRPLSELTFAGCSTAYDAVTPYGYGGLVRVSGRADIHPEALLPGVFSALR